MTRPVVPVVLSGGSGTRLWPLSRADKPKQFLPLVAAETLFQQTLQRLDGIPGLTAPIVVCSKAHRDLVAEQLREIDVEPGAIVLEPAGRNTAPAVAAAALVARDLAQDPVLLVLPADHVIVDSARFREAVADAVVAAEAGHLVTFGVVPTRPETGYGYVKRGADEGAWSRVERFVEKPDRSMAETYVESGQYFWNSGMFVFLASTVLDEIGRHATDMLAACRNAVSGARREAGFTHLGTAFLDSPSESLDYAVMEKTDRAAVVPFDAGWSDIGSWAALSEVLAADADGNVAIGHVETEGCASSHFVATSRLVAGVGLENIVVVETEDAVLVMSKDEAQRLKRLVDRLDPKSR